MRPSAHRKEIHMLKKIIIASALGLAFFTSFHIGTTGFGSTAKVTTVVKIASTAGACNACSGELCCYPIGGCDCDGRQ
jgi:hypothetical protein